MPAILPVPGSAFRVGGEGNLEPGTLNVEPLKASAACQNHSFRILTMDA